MVSYCCAEHQKLDWAARHKRCCPTLKALREDEELAQEGGGAVRTQLDLDVTAGLLALGPARADLTAAGDPVLSHFRPVASPRCWQEYVNLLHVRQLDASAGRTPRPPGCSATGKPHLQHMCEQLGMLTPEHLSHAIKKPAAPDAAGHDRELFWPRMRLLTEKAHWALTIVEGARRFGLLDAPAAGPRKEPMHVHVIGAQDNKDEGAITAAAFRELPNLLGESWPEGVVLTLVGPAISGTNHKIRLTPEMAAGPGGRLRCRVRRGLYHEQYQAKGEAGRWRWMRKRPGGADEYRGSGEDKRQDRCPDLAVMFNAGVHSTELLAGWAPTLRMLLAAEVPCVLTAFDEGEAARAELVLTAPTAAGRGAAGVVDLRAKLTFNEVNRWGSLLRGSHPGEPLYTLQQVFANSKCWMGMQGTLRAGAEPERSALSNAWLDSDAGRDWLTLVSG